MSGDLEKQARELAEKIVLPVMARPERMEQARESRNQRVREVADLVHTFASHVRSQAEEELVEALQGLVYLTDQGREGGLILSRYDHKPLTNGDQDVIDRAYIAAENAIKNAAPLLAAPPVKEKQ